MRQPWNPEISNPRAAGRRRRLAAGLASFFAAFVLAVLLDTARRGEAGPAPDPDPGARAGAGTEAPARLAPEALARAESTVEAALAERAFPGAALAIGVGPRVEHLAGLGKIGWREAAAPVSPDTTVYDLASVTKAVATSTAVLLLVDDGKITLDEPVQRWLPRFEGQLKDRVTWRHLLTHTSGLPGGAVIRGSDPAERARRLLRTRIDLRPGTSVEYTDIGFLVLWEAAERVAGEPLERLLERRVWRPLGMRHTRFSPGQDCTACAPTLRLEDGTPYRGRPHDLFARRLGGVTGNAGLFSTAHDLARFAAMIANGGELDGVRILRRESVAELLRQQPGAGRRSLGWQAFCPDEPPSTSTACASPVAFGHTGFTGTSLWIDPRTRMWMVLLTNRTYDQRNPEAADDIGSLRARIWTTLAAPRGSS